MEPTDRIPSNIIVLLRSHRFFKHGLDYPQKKLTHKVDKVLYGSLSMLIA
jgi:hypothetical protein